MGWFWGYLRFHEVCCTANMLCSKFQASWDPRVFLQFTIFFLRHTYIQNPNSWVLKLGLLGGKEISLQASFKIPSHQPISPSHQPISNKKNEKRLFEVLWLIGCCISLGRSFRVANIHTYIYIYTCIYIHINIYIYTCIYIYIYISNTYSGFRIMAIYLLRKPSFGPG